MEGNNTSNNYKYIDTDIDRDLLIKNLLHNAQSYARYKGWDESKAKEFYDALGTFKKAMEEDRLSSDFSGSIIDSMGELSNGEANWRDKNGKVYTEEQYKNLSDRQKRRKGWAHDFYANREVASYIGEVAKRIYDKTKEEAEKNKPVPRKFDLKNDGVWGKFVLSIAPNGNLDTDSWLALDPYDSAKKTRGTQERAGALVKFIDTYKNSLDENLDFSGSSFGTRNAYIERLSALSKALENGVNEQDYMLLNQLGGDPDQYKAFFTTAEKYSSEASPKTEEKPAGGGSGETEENKRLNALAKSYVDKYNKKKYKIYTLRTEPKGVKFDTNAKDQRTAYQNALNAAKIDFSANKLKSSDGGEYVHYIKQYGKMNPNAVKTVHIGKYAGWNYIPESLNPEDLSVLSYNPYKNAVARLYYGVLDSEAWEEYRNILEQIGAREQRSAAVPFRQQGGTVETVEQQQSSSLGAVELFDQQQKALSKKTKSDPKLRQPWKGENNYSSNEFTVTDKARLGAIAADIAALVDPEPISAGVLGIGSDITNFVADIKEGYGVVNSLGNFAGNLGLSVLGVVPVFGDALGSGSKIVKGLVKFAPKINKLLLGTGILAGVSNADEIIKSFSKIGKDGPENEMNVQDWRNVGLCLQYVLGGASAARNARAVKKVQQAKTASATDYIDVRVKDQSSGQEKVLRFGGKKDTEALKNAKTPDEVNAVINSHPSMKDKYKVATEAESSHKTHLFSAGYDQGKWYKPWTWREKISSDNLAEGAAGTVYDAQKFHNNYNVTVGRGQHLNNFVTDTNADKIIARDYKPKGGTTPISKMRELTLRRKAAQYRQSFKSTVGKAHSPEFNELIARGFTSADLRSAGLWQQGGTIGTSKQTKNDPKPSQSKKDENNHSSIEFTNNDLIRLGDLSADIVALIDPEPVSALALGVGSDAANLVADIREGKDFPIITNNLLQNLGMSSLGVIPIVGDVAGSGSKIGKTLAKLAPKLTKFIRAVDVYDIKAQADEIAKSLDVKGTLKSLNKVGKDGLKYAMTRQDWENIRKAIQVVLASAHTNIDTGTVGTRKKGGKLVAKAQNGTNIWAKDQASVNDTTTAQRFPSRTMSAVEAASTGDTGTKSDINLGGILEAIAPNAIAVGRYLAARNNNKKLLDIARQMPVMLYDPSERHRWIYGDQAAVQRGYQAAGQLNHLASRTITSDGAQQQAAQMEALMKGQQYIDQGNQQNDKVIQATREANWEQEGKNQESRYTTAMRNRANLSQKRTNDLSALGSYHRANYESLNALLGQFETQAQDKAEENKAYRQAVEQASLQNDITANLHKYGIQATGQEQVLINDVFSGTKIDLTDEEQQSYDRISNAIKEEVTKRTAAARGVTYRPFRPSTSTISWFISADKRGGVIEKSEKVTIQEMKGKIEKMKIRQKHLEARMNAFEKDLDRAQKSTSQYLRGQLKK